ncbi:MAG: DUF3823 domain-containing protein [Tannerellaceae bacterium]|nr:DUF3823 domain-containing protein [Tannerellaceae bacterium]
MKKIVYLLSGILLLAASCAPLDNYDEPEETLRGTIIDKGTGKGVQTEVGDGGIRLKLMEYSWSDNPEAYYFTCMQDGTFNNTRIFKGNYGVTPLGAFVPVEDEKIIDIKGVAELNFEVEPFLRVEWVGSPVVNSNGSITVKVKVTRGTANPAYQQDLNDITLFINSSSPYVGDNNYDNRYITRIEKDDNPTALLDQEITLTTSGEFSKDRTYYIRVGARIDVTIDGRVRYNYNEPLTVEIN